MSGPIAPRAIVFDMDGTLIDSYETVIDAYARTVEEAGELRTREQILEALAGGPAERIITSLLGRPAANEEVETYHRLLSEVAGTVQVYPGIRSVLAALPIPAAVFTGASERSAEILLTGAGLAAHFRVVIGGDRVEHQKPAPDGLVEAGRALGLHPHEIAYVGDAPYDVACALSAGALAVAAGWGELFDATVPAQVVLRRPEDLLDLLAS